MTSLKRGVDSEDSFETSHYTSSSVFSSLNSSQHPPSVSSPSSQEQPSYSDRGWKSIFPELVGIRLSDDVGLLADESRCLEANELLRSTDLGCANIESWMSKELQQDPIVKHVARTNGTALVDEPNAQQWTTCLGMIYRSRVKLIGDMSAVLRALDFPDVQQTQSRSHFLLDIVLDGDHLFATITNGLHLAQLNHHLEESLVDIVKTKATQLQAVIHKRTLVEDVSSATKAKDAHTNININVYGSNAASQMIGRHLSSKKVWLQRPDWYTPGCVYDNPHVVKVAPMTNEIDEPSTELAIKESEEETLQHSVQAVYSMLTRDAHLTESTAKDDRLKTSLLPHQAKAQNFMRQRETGPIPEEYEMWETISKNDETWYQHKVAGIKSRSRPTETGGGILADEMGMGKTFSMLSLLVSSLDAARKWAMDPETKLTDEILPSKMLSRATLIVVPSPLLLATWTDEIESRLNIKLKVFLHHGRDRPILPEGLVDNDVVLTTYHTLIADHNKQCTPIVGVAWYRIILDEAHFIRSSTTYLHKRVAELDAKYRWCLTGTPIQNRLDDVGALLAFLKIFPFDHLNIFRRCISVPFKEVGPMRITAQQNLAKVLDALCIRRTKALLNLSNFHETVCSIRFSEEERHQYNKTNEDMKRAMRHTISESASSSRFGMFQAQLQLRLLCNHGTFQHQFHWARARNLLDECEDATVTFGWDDSEGTCSSCQQFIPAVELAIARNSKAMCAHLLCQECRQGIDGDCPLCEVIAFGQKHDKRGIVSRTLQAREAYFQSSGKSSKMDALVRELQNADLSDKSIIFSHWTTTLDLIGRHLKRSNIYFERIDGNDDLAHRKRILHKFKNDESLKILVMTTGVGAFGLDLIAANRVHLVEPQWNPSIELQAIGRTLRIGQQKTVKVTRYIVENSIERDMQHLQRHKLRMAGMATTTNGIAFEEGPSIKTEFQTHSDSVFQ